MLAASAALFALFVVVERRIARRGGQPLISGRVLRAPSLRPAALAIFMIMAAFAGFLFAFALHQQAGLGHEALRAGLCSAPVALGFGLSSLHWHRLPARLHGVLPVIAAALLAPGYLLLGVLLGDGADIGAQALAVTAVLGLIAGCAYSPLFARALGGVDPADAADASGVMVTVVQLGQVVGVAVLGSVFLGGADLPASAGESGHALLVTTAVIAAAVAVAAVAAARTRRTAKG
ncbi:MFS transporter [Kitasatospora aburaviensis]